MHVYQYMYMFYKFFTILPVVNQTPLESGVSEVQSLNFLYYVTRFYELSQQVPIIRHN